MTFQALPVSAFIMQSDIPFSYYSYLLIL